MVDDPFVDVIQATVQALDSADVVYAITGSVVSGVFGEPVTSQDVDFCLRMSVGQAQQIDRALPQRFYRSAERLEAVAQEGGIANLIDTETTLKVDLSVLPSSPFFDSVLARRVLTAFGPDGPSFYTVTPEDIILMKLDWRRDTKSTKQWENALSVVRARGTALDWKYLFAQADALDLPDDLAALRDEAGV